MFSSIFYQNKIKFPNEDKMKKLMKESIDKYIQSLDKKYKTPLKINTDIKIESENVSSIINLFPFIIFGWGVYQLSKGVFINCHL